VRVVYQSDIIDVCGVQLHALRHMVVCIGRLRFVATRPVRLELASHVHCTPGRRMRGMLHAAGVTPRLSLCGSAQSYVRERGSSHIVTGVVSQLDGEACTNAERGSARLLDLKHTCSAVLRPSDTAADGLLTSYPE
jgi:hypothetical protein